MKLLLIGGFLGSGKTTAISNSCLQLINEGIKVAVITNDQGDQQVDSAHFEHINIPVKEVSNGCFCCNYSQLDNHVQSLLTEFQPEIIFAESVGSCTDMVATIAKPLGLYRPECELAISVFTDVSLLLAIMEGSASFVVEQVQYIYKKQLEEADILVLNKTDLINWEQLEIVGSIIKNDYPDKIILHQNSMDTTDIRKWIESVRKFRRPSPLSSLDIDYDVYASGEAQLAWLDSSMHISSPLPNSAAVAFQITKAIFLAIQKEQWTIGHLKCIIEAENRQQKISYSTMSQAPIDFIGLPDTHECRLLINARVQTEPSGLKRLVENVLRETANKYDCFIKQVRQSSFAPGYPKPTHRFA